MIKQKTNDMGFSEYNRDLEFEYQKLDWVWVRSWKIKFVTKLFWSSSKSQVLFLDTKCSNAACENVLMLMMFLRVKTIITNYFFDMM